jgi:hypothetical protein
VFGLELHGKAFLFSEDLPTNRQKGTKKSASLTPLLPRNKKTVSIFRAANESMLGAVACLGSSESLPLLNVEPT